MQHGDALRVLKACEDYHSVRDRKLTQSVDCLEYPDKPEYPIRDFAPLHRRELNMSVQSVDLDAPLLQRLVGGDNLASRQEPCESVQKHQ